MNFPQYLKRLMTKRSFQPAGAMQGGVPPAMDPSMMQAGAMPPGGQMPMDPSMMQGGAMPPGGQAPMDPSMMQAGAPPGQMPMDPSMMQAPPGIDMGQGMPVDPMTGQPIDPAMLAQMGGGQPMEPMVADMTMTDFKDMLREVVSDVLINGKKGASDSDKALSAVNDKLDALTAMMNVGPGSTMMPPPADLAAGGAPMAVPAGAMEAQASVAKKESFSLADTILRSLRR